tara:strand:+ start:184 stop:393 length:210 start_codon:yes stop_codon:yes gene_type:complete
LFVRLKVEVLVPDGPEQEVRDCEIDEEGSGIVVVVVVDVVVVDVIDELRHSFSNAIFVLSAWSLDIPDE